MKKIGLFVLLLLFSLLSLVIGVKDIALSQLFQLDAQQQFVLFTTRVPRTLSLIIAGSTMSISGLIMQQLTQNKFVAPSVAGTTDSARLGILVAMLFFPTAPFLYRTAIAFIFALSGTLLFLALIRLLPSKNQVMVPLVGVMFGNILGSIATFFAYQYQLVQNMSAWLFLMIPLWFVIYLFAYHFTVVGMGEAFANSLGVHYQRIQFLGLTLVALASAIVLLMVGNIPFLGVVIPNLVSLRYGDHMKNTLWLTGICGSLFLLICDILARVLIAPYEIPVSVVVGTLGSILFILLLLRGRKQ